MAITKYIDPVTNEELHKVRVSKRCSTGGQVELQDKGYKTQAEAEKAQLKLLVQLERDVIAKEQKGCLWGSLLRAWEIAAKKGDIFIRQLSPQTIEDYAFIINDHCKEWNDLPVHDIDRAKAWVVLDRVEREISVSRRKRLRTAIDAVFRWGTLSGRIKDLKVIPTEGYSSTRQDEEKMPEILNLEQIRILLDYAEKVQHPWYAHWALALFTGMRSGELYALEWDQVDFDNKLIFVHKNWTNRKGYGPTKGRYWRAVPIESPQIISLLKELKIKSAGERHEPNRKFVLHKFKDWTDGEQAQILREFCIGSGLPSIRFHTLRACFATQLIRDGVAPAVVMKICGWKDLKTMQRYIRLAGIEVKGATQGLKLLPEREVMGRVVSLFRQE